ncbi:Vacuolar protein 8 [Mortierella alpina]|uniref:Vacuolar protein 8 n=1 Tax=Mortierella alpina TaxID=64518 RepID=A0A9P6J3F2_MORAP|nr:Vacuolar protein 8 [Mortierella alpina]
MTTIAPQNGPQAFCPAYINSNGSGITFPASSTVNISSRFDSRSGQHVVLWSDISRVFEDVKYVLCGNTAVSPLVDDNFVVYDETATAIPAGAQAATVRTVVLVPSAPQDLSGVGSINGHAARKPSGRAPAELVNDNPFYTDIGGPINKARLVLNPQGIVDDNRDDIDYSASVRLDETLSTSHTGTSQDSSLFSQQIQPLSLSSLAFSDQEEHQRAAAIEYQEYTKKNKTALDVGILKAIVRLLKSSNAEIQKSALKSAYNVLELHENADLFIQLNGLTPLNDLLGSPYTESALDAVGCINLIANDKNILAIVRSVDVTRLLYLAEFPDQSVQRRAAEALRNHSSSAEGRQAMVSSSAFPSLGSLLSSHDTNTKRSSIAAFKTIVEDKVQRANLLQVGPRFIPVLVDLLTSSDPDTHQCSVICLEYLAEDSTLGSEILGVEGLTALARTTMSDHPETVLAAVGCIFNLAAHRVLHRAILDSPLVLRLGDLIAEGTMLKVRLKAACVLRSLQESGEEVHKLMFTSGVAGQILTEVLQAPLELQVIFSESLLQLTSCASLRQQLLEMGLLSVLISLSGSEDRSIKNNSSEAIFNLAQRAKDFEPFLRVWEEPSGGLNGFLLRSLSKQEKPLQYLGLSILLELLQQRSNKELRRMIKNSPEIISSSSHLRPLKNLNSKNGLYNALIAQQVIRLLK